MNLTAVMTHVANGLAMDGNSVRVNPFLMTPAPTRLATVGHDGHVRGISQDRQRVFDGFVGPAVNGDTAVLNAISIAVFAKKHAMPQAGFYAGNIRWNVKNAGGQ